MNGVLIIGCGNLGKIILNSLIKKKINVVVFEKNKKIRALLRKNKKVLLINELSEIKQLKIDYILLCVKPRDSISLLKNLKKNIDNAYIILSFVAGLTIKNIKKKLNVTNIVRIMPNIFIEVQKSATAIITSSRSRNLKQKIITDFSFFGPLIWLKEEKKIDFFTALYGGGPAYFFYFLNILVNVSKQNNIGINKSTELVLSLLDGTMKFVKKNGSDFPKLIQKVTSPNGTTEKAIEIFEKNKLSKIFDKAIMKAEKRSKDISQRLY